MFNKYALVLSLAMIATLMGSTGASAYGFSTPEEQLGKFLFFDQNLSLNSNQSCADCHAPGVGFTGPDATTNAGGAVYEGSVPNHFGNRKPPTAAYAGDSPIFHYDKAKMGWFGGMFWDGRATGNVLGDPLAEQAQGPYLNPLEQAIPNAKELCVIVKGSGYAILFEEVWGPSSLDCLNDVPGVYQKIGRSIAAYERSSEVNPFTSKFDQFWGNAKGVDKDVTKINCGMGGMGGGGMGGGGMGGGGMGCSGDGTDPNRWTVFRSLGLNDSELQGLAVFNDPNLANCASCHTLQPGSQGYPLFTDFGYDNLGIPKNPANPFYFMPSNWNPDGQSWVDYGLGGYLKSAGYRAKVYKTELGKFKVPTLRNVNLRPSEGFVKAYGHNGYFKSLDDIVFFYHWRAMMNAGMGGGGMGNMFPPPEVNQNLAALGMFPGAQVGNIVLFLKTLSDGYYQR